MSTIRHGELINQDLLDERGLRKHPYEHEKLKKDERKVVIKFTDQSYLRVVLVNGDVVRLRELRENIYRWFPELNPARTGPTFRAVRAPAALARNRVNPDDAFKSQVKNLVDRIMDLDGNFLDTRVKGRVSVNSVTNDFQQMEALADVAILLEKVTISESTEMFNVWFPKSMTHNKSYLWLRTAFLTRQSSEPYLLNSIRRALLPQERLEFDDESRRLQLTAYMDYLKYKLNKAELMERPTDLAMKIEQLTEITRGRLFLEQIKTIQSYEDRVMIRMQYLLIEKVLKPLQRK